MEQEVQELIRDWHINKAKNEQEPFFRFLCHWICLNAWLDYRSDGILTDSQMLNWLKNQTKENSDLIASYEAMKVTTDGVQNLRNLVSAGPIGGGKGRPAITMKSVDDRDKIIDAIYRIRCNLFHGSKQASNTRDIKLVSYANRIMTSWIDELIASW